MKGFTGDELIADRKKCLLTGYRMMRVSLRACSRLPYDQRLALYASGRCSMGHAASIERMKLARTWYNQHQPQFNDEQAFWILTNPDSVLADLYTPSLTSGNN